MINRFVITGGPATGKSAIIKFLQQQHYHCFTEVSREIIDEKKIETTSKDIDFEAAVFNQRKIDFLAGNDLHFYDRSMLDGLAYMDINNISIPKYMQETLRKYHYHKRVFYAPIWKEIYTKDTQRLESIEEAIVIDKSLRKVYQAHGYELIELPFTSIAERVNFILSKI